MSSLPGFRLSRKGEPALLLTRLLRGLGEHGLDDRGERHAELLARLHAAAQLGLELFMRVDGLLPLDLNRAGDELLVRRSPVPLERIVARKEISAAIAEGDFPGVRLRRVAVTLEVFPVAEVRARAEAAPGHLDHLALPVCWCCRSVAVLPFSLGS